MPLFMHKYIKRIIDIDGDVECGFQVVPGLLDKKEEDRQLVHL